MGSDVMSILIHPEDLPKVFANFDVIQRLSDGETASIECRAKTQEKRLCSR